MGHIGRDELMKLGRALGKSEYATYLTDLAADTMQPEPLADAGALEHTTPGVRIR
jgi:hypothetical protein